MLILPHSCVESANVLEQIRKRSRSVRRQLLEQFTRSVPDGRAALRQHEPEFGKQPSQAVDRGRALLDEPLPDTMQTEHRLLFGVYLMKRICGRLTASQIASASLPSFLLFSSIRRNEARRHQLNLVPKPLQTTRPLVRSGASLQSNHARRLRLEQLHQSSSRHRLAQHHRTHRIDPVHRLLCFAKSIPTVVNVAHDFPFSSWLLNAHFNHRTRVPRDGEVPYIR